MADGEDDEVLETGTDGQGAEGTDPAGGKPDTEVSAEQPDPEENDGEPEVAEGGEKPSRGETRFQKLANETKAAREEAAAARREAEELRRQQWQRQEQQTEQQQREMLALMTPDERAEYRINQFQRQTQQERQQDRIQTQVLMDKTAFDAKATINPVYAKFKDEVEQRFQTQLQQGRPVEREIILKLLLGERALSGAANGGARKQAKGRVESQRVAPGSGRGDAQADRGKAGDSPEKRLKDVYI